MHKNIILIKEKFNLYFEKIDILNLVILFIIIAGIILRFIFLFQNESFWYDTCALGANLQKDYLKFFKPLEFIQVAPPLFMILSKFICSIFYQGIDIEQKDFILRLIPFFSGIITLPLFTLLVNKMFNNKNITAVSLFMLSFNPWHIYYSCEFKPYSSDCLIAVILLLMFFSIDLKEIPIKRLAFISLFFAISVWLSNSAIFILVSGFLTIFIDILRCPRNFGVATLKGEHLYGDNEREFRTEASPVSEGKASARRSRVSNYPERKEISRQSAAKCDIRLDKNYFDYKKILLMILPLLISIFFFYFFYYKQVYYQHYTNMYHHWRYIEPSFMNIHNFKNILYNKIHNITGFYGAAGNLFFLGLNIILLLFSRKLKVIILLLLPVFLTIIYSFSNLYPFEKRLILFLFPILFIIYSQIISFLKDSKNAKIVLSVILLYLTIQCFQTTLNKEFIYNKSNVRELYTILKKNNPELKNVICMDELYSYYSGQKADYSDRYTFIKDFSTSSMKKYINNLPKGEYWILLPDSLPEYRNSFINYLKTNKTIELKSMYADDNYQQTFLANIKINKN